MSCPGRKRDFVWLKFTEIADKTDTKTKRVKCKSCGDDVVALVERMKSHVAKCKGMDADDIEIIGHENVIGSLTLNTSDTQQSPVTGQTTAGLSQPNTISTLPKKPKLNVLERNLTKTSVELKDKLDLHIARFVYATNSPFRLVNHPEFVKLVTLLGPGYTPPNRVKIANDLLDRVYEQEQHKNYSELENMTVCFSLDGWENIHSDHIVSTSLTTEDGKTFLVDSTDTSGNSHTAEYLLSLIAASIEKVQNQYKAHVGSVNTDNTANVEKMRKELAKIPKYSHVLTYGCSSHLLNLLAQDMQIDGVMGHVVKIVKYFRNNRNAAALYRDTTKPKLILPIEVRWSTTADCLETLIKQCGTLFTISEENRDEIDVNIQQKVRNMALKRNAEDLLQRLKPISVALDILQRSTSKIADTVEVFKNLKNQLTGLNLPTSAMRAFNKREKQAIKDFHLLAYLLHPKYAGQRLTPDVRASAMAYAEKFSEKIPMLLPSIIKFNGRGTSALFQKYLFTEAVVTHTTAAEWWRSLSTQIEEDVLKFILRLMTAAATTTSLERLFSTYGFVQSDVRNRLGNEKTAKLVFLFRALNNT